MIFPNPNAPTGRLLPLSEIAQWPPAGLARCADRGRRGLRGFRRSRRDSHPPSRWCSSSPASWSPRRCPRAVRWPGCGWVLRSASRSSSRPSPGQGQLQLYPLDRLALVGASAAMDDEAGYETTRRQVIASREALTAELGAPSFEVLPSAANFVFARHRAATPPSWPPRCGSAASSCGTSRRPHRPVPAHHRGHRRPVRTARRGAAGDPRPDLAMPVKKPRQRVRHAATGPGRPRLKAQPFRRISAERAWACRPSPWASTDATLPRSGRRPRRRR